MYLYVGTGVMDNIDPKTKCCMTGNLDNTCKNMKVNYKGENDVSLVNINRPKHPMTSC